MTNEAITTENNSLKLTKNLARCKPSEFMAQCVKIRYLVEKWVKDIDILEIRKSKPDLLIIPPNTNADAAKEITEENNKRIKEAVRANFLKLFDKMFVEYPTETMSVLALTCFVEPAHMDDYEMADYMDAVREMWQDRAVVDFFTFLVSLVQKSISRQSKA